MLHLITGGARSGKSAHAERLAHHLGGERVTYLATLAASDDEMRRRVARHRARRPAAWTTVELTREVSGEAVASVLARAAAGTVLLDCVGGLISAIALEHVMGDAPDGDATIAAAAGVAEALVAGARDPDRTLIAVTNEVGSGVVPATRLGRRYRDALGLANQRLARDADTVTLLTAGIPLRLKGAPLTER